MASVMDRKIKERMAKILHEDPQALLNVDRLIAEAEENSYRSGLTDAEGNRIPYKTIIPRGTKLYSPGNSIISRPKENYS